MKRSKREARPLGITVVALLMIIFGLAEVVAGFTHSFFGISTANNSLSAYAGASIGAFYAIAGLLILTMKKKAAVIAMVLLAADIIGRILLVITGFYPTNSFEQTFAIIAGTAIAASFAIYIRLKWKIFK